MNLIMKKRITLKLALTLMLIASALTCLIIMLTIWLRLGVFSGRFMYVRQYAALIGVIDKHFIGQADFDDIHTSAMRSAVRALDDRWSYYMTPDELVSYQTRTGNRFTGIGVGIEIDEATGGMRVYFVYRGSEAETAGLVAGDIIIGIDGVDVTGYEIDMVRDLLQRPIGSIAEISVLRADGTVDTIPVVYGTVFIDPVSYEMIDENIGYIALSNFNYGTANSFINALDHLMRRGALSFVFDVRSNGGGTVAEMTKILDHLLPEGEIFIAVDRSGEEHVIYSAGPGQVDLSAVVLVDRGSFSAAEYFAALLCEYGYADIIGEQTSGKSRSQQVFRLPGGGAANISSAQYLTKNRVSLFDAGGLTPNHIIPLTDYEYALVAAGNLEKSADPQLNKAIALLTKQ